MNSSDLVRRISEALGLLEDSYRQVAVFDKRINEQFIASVKELTALKLMIQNDLRAEEIKQSGRYHE